MVTKPLRKNLIKRLKKAAHKIDSRLGRMRNVDWMVEVHPKLKQYISSTNSREGGFRVREMNVSRNYPKTRLVIKRSHGGLSAKQTIEMIEQIVKKHNLLYTPSNYQLLQPKAYPISHDLIAMHLVKPITIFQMYGFERFFPERERLLEKIKQRNPNEKKDWEKELHKACDDVVHRTGLYDFNILVLGYKKGRFVFMPLADVS